MFGNNSALLAIYEPGTPDDYGDVETAGAELWAGRAACYLTRERHRSGPDMTLAETDVLYVRDGTGVAQVRSLTPGDQRIANTILVEDQRVSPPVTRRFRVMGIQHRAGIFPIASTRLVLEDERAS